TATTAGETYLKLTYCSSETSLGMGRGCCMLNGCIATTQFAGFWFVELDRIGRSGQWIVCGQYVCHHAGGRWPACSCRCILAPSHLDGVLHCITATFFCILVCSLLSYAYAPLHTVD